MAGRRRPQPGSDRDVAALARHLGELLRDLGLTEIEASVGQVHVRLQRALPAPGASLAPAAPEPPAATAALPSGAAVPAGAVVTVEAPMVGTFYRASSPGADPYVREGDLVKEGQVLCIIEAMKLMNEIEARTAGRIVAILVENGQPVEYGQPLFHVEPVR